MIQEFQYRQYNAITAPVTTEDKTTITVMCTFYPQIIGKHESEDGDALIVIGTRHGSGEMRGIKEKGFTVHFIINI